MSTKVRAPWMPLEEMDQEHYQFELFLDVDTGMARTLLWNPQGFFEWPEPIGKKWEEEMIPTHFMKIPPHEH